MSDTKSGQSVPAASVPIPRSKRGLKGFLQDTTAEMKKVAWPTRKETSRLTFVVVAVCTGAILVLWLLGLGFEVLIHQILIKKGGA